VGVNFSVCVCVGAGIVLGIALRARRGQEGNQTCVRGRVRVRTNGRRYPFYSWTRYRRRKRLASRFALEGFACACTCVVRYVVCLRLPLRAFCTWRRFWSSTGFRFAQRVCVFDRRIRGQTYLQPPPPDSPSGPPVIASTLFAPSHTCNRPISFPNLRFFSIHPYRCCTYPLPSQNLIFIVFTLSFFALPSGF
jgi:hypothetical protein